MACSHGAPIGEHCPVCKSQRLPPQVEDTLANDLTLVAHSHTSVTYGWICPKCKSAFAPHVNECRHCSAGPELT